MNSIKRILKIIFFLLIMLFIFRNWVYQQIITYKSVGYRTNQEPTKEFINFIDAKIDKPSAIKIEEIIELSLISTSKQLDFTFHKSEIDANKLINSKSTNCIGYAAFFATTCNYHLLLI